MPLPRRFLVGLSLLVASGRVIAAAAALPDRPDPREIPVPEIATTLPHLPGAAALPIQPDLPDVFTLNDGTRVTTPEQWARRRTEIRTILEYYHTGRLPPAPGNVRGVELSNQLLHGGTITYRLIKLVFGPGEKLSLHIGIYAPVGRGPVPTVIQPGNASPPGAPELPKLPPGPGQGRGWDILLSADLLATQAAEASPHPTPALTNAPRNHSGFGGPVDPEHVAATNLALAHGFAYVTFNVGDCAEDTTLREPDGSFAFRTTRFFPAYPGYDWGIIGGWVWGTMRVVDYLQHDPSVDPTKLIITGTSRIGKAAMISGAFDDRIALVAPGASSGLGTPAYRFSGEDRGGGEGLTTMVRKYANQFSPHLHEFWGQPERLPYDAHWFPALTAPRPWIALEGTRDPNVSHRGILETWSHARPVYAFLGAADRIGVYWSDRPHGFGETDWDGLLAFADKHLLHQPVSRAFDLFPADASPTTAPTRP